MYRVSLPPLGFTEQWRVAARRLLSHGIAPEEVTWDRGEGEDLFPGAPLPTADGPHPVIASKAFLDLTRTVLCHTDPDAPGRLYRALHRHQHDRRALGNPADPLTRRLERDAKAIRRDIHKMHAFLRFRELPSTEDRRAFGAWFEPDNHILEAATPFFAKRFGDMDWTIATPQGIARFDAGQLTYHPPSARPDLPEDASEALWGTYFANIFNPARLHLQAMRSEMPLKYWKNLPETRLIPEMLAGAEARVAAMRAAMPTEPPARAARILRRLDEPLQEEIPQSLTEAQAAALRCRRCGLCEAATQTVWGKGSETAAVMIVGEQPGDAEDLAGEPFVGPAGTVLRAAMSEARLEDVWLTNAVKHFKFQPRGKRRIHQSPARDEIDKCRWWLATERRLIRPRLTLALGASAAYALTGDGSSLTARRGKIETALDGGPVLISWHPSYILRSPEPKRAQLRAELVADLRTAGQMAADTAA